MLACLNPEILKQHRRPISAACFHKLTVTLEGNLLGTPSGHAFRPGKTNVKIVEIADFAYRSPAPIGG
jgi:hypothetical protein